MFHVIVNRIPRCILDLVIWYFGIQCFGHLIGSPVRYSPHCVDDVYCVAIHDLSPVLTALFSIELGGFISQHKVVAHSQHIQLRIVALVLCHFEVAVSQHSRLKKSTRCFTFSHRRGLFVMILFGLVPSFVLTCCDLELANITKIVSISLDGLVL